MIIKPMSRKSASFRQLIDYFHKEANPDAPTFQWNMYGSGPDEVVNEFEDNAERLVKRANGNYLYHETIALPENKKIPYLRQAAMLKDIVREYVQRRCPNQMVYGKLHKETDNLHFHLCISANGIGKQQRHWLYKRDLNRIQREVEAYKIFKYPELGTERYYDRSGRQHEKDRDEQPKLTRHEQQQKQRTGELSRKERDHQIVRDIYGRAKSETDLNDLLQSAGFNSYTRGRTEGVIAMDGRKYRLKTLGLETALQTTKARIEVYAERQAELSKGHDIDQDHNRERE